MTGVPTGFLDLDRLTAGLQPSDLIIVAGRPSMGKTSWVLNVAEHVAIEAEPDKRVGVGLFSLEVWESTLAEAGFEDVERITSRHSDVDEETFVFRMRSP